jgi:uncharacterized membrane protein YbhN (UPF0104 family)
MNRSVAARIIIGVAVSAAAVLLVVQSADLPAAVSRVTAIDPRALLVPVLVVLVQLAIRAARWALLLTAVGPIPVGAGRVIGPLSVGYLGNTVLPARLGEVVRIVLVSRRAGVPATTSTASVVVERGVDLLALLAIATVASGFLATTSWLPFVAVLALLVGVGLVLPTAAWLAGRVPARLPSRVGDALVGLLRAFAAARPGVVARAWLLSLLAWACDALVIWLCAQALAIPLGPGAAALVAAGAAIGAALPAAAGYVGTYELGALTAAAFVGLPADQALQVALLGHAIAVVPLAIVGLAALVGMSIRPVSTGVAIPTANTASEP